MFECTRLRGSRHVSLLGLAGLAVLAACAAPTAGEEGEGEREPAVGRSRQALSTAAPAWIAYPGGPEANWRNSLLTEVGKPVRMAPLYGGGAPTAYAIRGLASIYGGSNELPRGLAFDTATGLISGSAAEPTAGVSYFAIRASNDLGVAAGQSGWGEERILRVNVVLAGTPITRGWYLTDAWDGVYRDTADAMIAAAPELLRAQRLRTFGDFVTYSVDWKAPVWTPWAPASRRVGFAGRMLWGDGREWPYNNIAADLWCNGNATTNVQVSTAGDITTADPNYKAAAPAGECLCPAGTAWNPLGRDGAGNCDRVVSCTITTSSCPSYPAFVGTFGDIPDYWSPAVSEASTSTDQEALCASRAKLWYDRCGADAIVKSELVVNRAVVATAFYPNAPAPEPTPPPAPTVTSPPPAPTVTSPPPAPTVTPPPPAPKPRQLCKPSSVTCIPAPSFYRGPRFVLQCNPTGTSLQVRRDTANVCPPPPPAGPTRR